MKDVFLYQDGGEPGEISFVHEPGRSVCIGETDGTLQDFLDWMRADWLERGRDVSTLPTVREEVSP